MDSVISTLVSSLETAWLVAVGCIALGFMIFVHELGHFLVAKWCGVRCDKFYLGFDIAGLRLFRFKWGETEYGIGILPLGGYVKMLGQEDNPARLRDEIERAKRVETPSMAFAEPKTLPPLSGEEIKEAEELLYDPRSFLAQSVPKRMAIIVAGVGMNMIFAFLAAIWAYWLGVDKPACVAGLVSPGDAAWRAGIRPGDRFVEIAGKPSCVFHDLMARIALGDIDNGVSLKLERAGLPEPFSVVVHPDRRIGRPTIGVGMPPSLEMPNWGQLDNPGLPAASATPPFKPGDTIVSVDAKKVEKYVQFQAELVKKRSKTLEIGVLRESDHPSAGKEKSDDAAAKLLTVRVAPNPMRVLGLAMAMGDITAIQAGSPAEDAGLKRGDRIEACDGKSIADPMAFPELLAAAAGSEVALKVYRPELKDFKIVTVRPREVDWMERPLHEDSPVPVPALGLTYQVLNRIQSVEPGSAAAGAGLKSGDIIARASVLPPAESKKKQTKSSIKFSETERRWPYFFYYFQDALPDQAIELELADGRTVKMMPVDSATWFNPDRGFLFNAEKVTQVANSPVDAIRLGWAETVDSTTIVINSLRKLQSGQVSLRQMHGPIKIFETAMDAAQEGLSKLLIFITIVSANLAVINLLPIPVLDGGILVFLGWEAIFRKPASERVQVILTYMGLVLLLALMVFVLGLDFGLISRN